jgi:hypothetical protein
MSLQACAAIQRRKAQSKPQPQPPTQNEAQHAASYRQETRGREETQAFRVLSAPCSPSIIERALPPIDLSFGGWGSVLHDPTPRWNHPRTRKELTDRAYPIVAPSEPSTLKPGPRLGWRPTTLGDLSLRDPVEIKAEQALDEFNRLSLVASETFRGQRPKKHCARCNADHDPALHFDRFQRASIHRPSSVTGMEGSIPDVSLEIVPKKKRTSQSRLAAYAGKKLRQLVDAKEAKTLAEVAAWDAQGLSQREIAEKVGLSRRQVQTRLMHFSKILIATASTG